MERKRKANLGNSYLKKRKKDDDGNSSADANVFRPIDLLSDEILVKIIKLVPVAQWPYLESVSRRFRLTVFEAWLNLTKIRLNEDLLIAKPRCDNDRDKTSELVNFILEKLSLRAPNLTDLGGFSGISYFWTLDDASIRWLTRFGQLQKLDISGCKIRLSTLANFLQTTPSRGWLTELQVDGKRPRPDNELLDNEEWQRQNQTLESAFGNENSNLPQLKLENFYFKVLPCNLFGFACGATLDVTRLTTFNSSYTLVRPVDLLSLLTRSTNLINLEFTFAKSYKNVGVELTRDIQILKTIAALENLSSLKINERHSGWCPQLYSEFVSMIVSLGRRRRLEEFSLLDRHICTATIVAAIAENLTHLKSLALGISKKISIDCVVPLVTNLKGLEKLTLGLEMYIGSGVVAEVNDDVLKAIATNLTELQSLRLSVAKESKTLNDLATLKHLKRLCLEGDNIVDEGMSTMKAWSAGFGPTLESVRLYGFRGITDEALIVLVENSPRLHCLQLAADTDVTDRGLRSIAESCPDLRRLSLSCRESENISVTVEGIQAIVDGCSRLNQLGIKSNNRYYGCWDDVKVEKYRKLKIN